MAKIAVAVNDASGGSHNMLYEDGNATAVAAGDVLMNLLYV